jgi:hypothetical protein
LVSLSIGNGPLCPEDKSIHIVAVAIAHTAISIAVFVAVIIALVALAIALFVAC